MKPSTFAHFVSTLLYEKRCVLLAGAQLALSLLPCLS